MNNQKVWPAGNLVGQRGGAGLRGLRKKSALAGRAVFGALFLLSLAAKDLAAAPSAAGTQVAGTSISPARLHFSASPTDAEISRARVFDEPLLSFGCGPDAVENAALARALGGYVSRAVPDDFSSLTGFLRDRPASRWRGSLLLHFGTEYYNSGCYSRALDAWERAWEAAKTVTSGPAKAQADRALGELTRMYANVGRTKDLAELLDATKDRPLEGPGTQLVGASRQVLWIMQNRPGTWFKCGPLALDRLLSRYEPAKAGNRLITECKGTTNGFSLAQVQDLSGQLGMHYQMAFRSNGAPVIVPSVVNWKVGHYAALVESNDNRFLAQDPTFRTSPWISTRTLEAETSGYFLVPAGSLPTGWRTVGVTEAQSIWGKGPPNGLTPGATSKYDCKSGGGADCGGMTTYTMHTMLASLNLNDSPVGYSPPVGPAVRFTVSYSQREASQPATFYYSNLGPKWTCNWISYINDNPSSPSADVQFYVDGGGSLTFTGFNPATGTYAPDRMCHALLTKTSGASYELLYPDGSKREFTVSDGSLGTSRRIFLNQVMDSSSNTLQLNYDQEFRITNIVDAIGQPTTLSYTNTAYPEAITDVTDPFGRAAHFAYNASGQLTQITDVLGITSQFAYDTNDFVTNLTTPYGATIFSTGLTNSVTWLQATDPLGASELLEINQNTPIPGSDPPATVPQGIGALNEYLVYRNSLFWGKRAFDIGPGDITQATIYHFLHEVNGAESPILESIKYPLENRIWNTYAGQSAGNIVGTNSEPSYVGRVLDDGTSQVSAYQYNALGHVTKATDPAGRALTLIYATNNVDLLEIHQTTGTNNDLVAKFQYDSRHLRVAIWDAAGQMTTNTFNARGQLLTTTDPKGQTTSCAYDSNGHLLSVDGPLPGPADTISYTYDSVGRVRTVTNPDGYSITNAYDNFDRITSVTYPDGTSEILTYNKLDLVQLSDRMSRTTVMAYDAMRRPISVQDPLNRVTRYQYCNCGDLTTLVDSLNRPTSWNYDVESRMTSKQLADGSRVLYTYENTTSRLKSVTDEKGQTRTYAYNPDNNFSQVTFSGAQLLTPVVTFTYDSNYNRMISMQDGIGTTTYSYNPAGTLGALNVAAITGPWTNETVSYQYDVLGHVVNRTLNGVAQTWAYDPEGRTTNIVNALGSFTYDYDGASERLLDSFYPNGQATHYTYFNNLGDRRLQSITSQKPDTSVISSFTYAYNLAGNVTNWLQQAGASTNNWSMGYDAADQLLSVHIAAATSNINYAYAYDAAGNRLFENTSATNRSFQYDSLNQLVSSSDSTPTNATYEWDAENRLTAINSGTFRSEFYYDGLDRRARIVEKTNGVVASVKNYWWCGTELCAETDTNGVVLQQFFQQGFVTNGANYFYTRDHLGSIRTVVNAAAQIQAAYAYTPFGVRSGGGGAVDAMFGFTGHPLHAASGLWLAPYRAYDGVAGRWLSRDPMEEIAGLNLYAYLLNDPMDGYDPLGLCPATLGMRLHNALIGAGSGALAGAVTAAGFAKYVWEAGPEAIVGIIGAGALGGGVSGAFEGFFHPCDSAGLVVFHSVAGGVGAGAGAAFAPVFAPLVRNGFGLTGFLGYAATGTGSGLVGNLFAQWAKGRVGNVDLTELGVSGLSSGFTGGVSKWGTGGEEFLPIDALGEVDNNIFDQDREAYQRRQEAGHEQ